MRHFTIILVLILSGCSVQKPTASSETRFEASKLIDKAVVQMREGDLDAAEATYQVAYDMAQIPAALDGLGSVAFIKGHFQTAEQYFWQAYNSPVEEYPNALGNLALLYEKVGEIEHAQKIYQVAVEQDPANFKIRSNYAAFLAEYIEKSGIQPRAKFEILKAEAIQNHPVIDYNKQRINRN